VNHGQQPDACVSTLVVSTPVDIDWTLTMWSESITDHFGLILFPTPYYMYVCCCCLFVDNEMMDNCRFKSSLWMDELQWQPDPMGLPVPVTLIFKPSPFTHACSLKLEERHQRM
jgi:hypothetical protein